ncbi:DUF72 domain-containing protein [Sphingobacterium sp. DR205]|uniref:DUF72 domain-containing protein n=1 Tax=Sphingobacterium sp. DR205 TaxID=2713573 RepID=UPI0013E48456|nr:DUF72 domain-containing protein [Sphingobacterium sp. DR205]QIH33995.1 DUF72 domain-containing protein [Sphingobacterium sp. DR205]
MKNAKIYIGTSGWHYKHWKQTFYPAKLKNDNQLRYFSDIFPTVEINNSFYRLPTDDMFINWYQQVPEDFIFAVKASRFITHVKKLHVDHDTIDQFMQRAAHLKEKLGPILFQLPPRWHVNTERLYNFLEMLPTDHRFVFEFRDSSWNIPEVYKLLEHYNCAYCIYDLAGYQNPVITTADFVYIRLHGLGNKYQGSYTKNNLISWVEKCTYWQDEGKDIYFYFDNDQNGYAPHNGQTLMKILK